MFLTLPPVSEALTSSRSSCQPLGTGDEHVQDSASRASPMMVLRGAPQGLLDQAAQRDLAGALQAGLPAADEGLDDFGDGHLPRVLAGALGVRADALRHHRDAYVVDCALGGHLDDPHGRVAYPAGDLRSRLTHRSYLFQWVDGRTLRAPRLPLAVIRVQDNGPGDSLSLSPGPLLI